MRFGFCSGKMTGIFSVVLLFGLFAALLGAALPAVPSAASSNDGFNPNANGSVYCIAVQPDGKILVGGAYTNIGGQARNYMARLNADGTLDLTFNPNASGDSGSHLGVSVALQADGKIVVGGDFTTIGGQARNYIARLSADEAAIQELTVSADGATVTWM